MAEAADVWTAGSARFVARIAPDLIVLMSHTLQGRQSPSQAAQATSKQHSVKQSLSQTCRYDTRHDRVGPGRAKRTNRAYQSSATPLAACLRGNPANREAMERAIAQLHTDKKCIGNHATPKGIKHTRSLRRFQHWSRRTARSANSASTTNKISTWRRRRGGRRVKAQL